MLPTRLVAAAVVALAALTLAASMHSSMMRCASLRASGTIFSILPRSSNTMRVSSVSKSIAPRRLRCAASASA